MADEKRTDKLTASQHLARLILAIPPYSVGAKFAGASALMQVQLESQNALFRARVRAVARQLNQIQLLAEGREDAELLAILQQEVDETIDRNE